MVTQRKPKYWRDYYQQHKEEIKKNHKTYYKLNKIKQAKRYSEEIEEKKGEWPKQLKRNSRKSWQVFDKLMYCLNNNLIGTKRHLLLAKRSSLLYNDSLKLYRNLNRYSFDTSI